MEIFGFDMNDETNKTIEHNFAFLPIYLFIFDEIIPKFKHLNFTKLTN